MLFLTLDTDCVIAVDENRSEASSIRSPAKAHSDGLANVGLIAIMASEKQKPGGYLTSFADFAARIALLGLSI